MIYCENSAINNIAIHVVGNKIYNEQCKLSKTNLQLSEADKALLVRYFFASFLRYSEYFNFYHNIDVSMNEAFVCTSKIFDDPKTLLEQSVNLTKHLYEQSDHPKIKGGEFYTVYFKDCIIDGKTVDAVGLFKSENKDTFLKVFPNKTEDGFEIESEQGININKLDKGCLIFNTERENGYVVAVVDNTNKGAEAQYWLDDFLHVRSRKDEYYNTQNVLTLAKHFIKDELPSQFEVTKADQIDLLNKSVKFFKEKDNFDLKEFANEVIEDPDIIRSFRKYKTTFEQDFDMDIADNFTISESAVKKQVRTLKSVIKLDKNFHIYIHGNRNLIEQGEDKKGKFYKVYYQEEN
ncbi:MAG: nucleoid-associated protein [Lentimicrobiaceae bacterium]|nr:nucleoid-associated protein [Lentimicrobiaceae bacterium]